MKIITNNPSQTRKIGEILAKEILKSKLEKAFTLGLEGDLGGGKTTFLQGFGKGLGIKEKILSPTFVIMKRFKIPKGKNFYSLSTTRWFYHLDCYRVKNEKDILNLGFKDLVLNSKNIIAVEWIEKIKGILPKNTLILKFKFLNKNIRKIKLKIKR